MKVLFYKGVGWIMRVVLGLAILAGVMLLLLSFTSTGPQEQELRERIIVLVCIALFFLSSIAVICYEGTKVFMERKTIPRVWTFVIRLVFYGLLLLCPISFSLGHACHVRAKLYQQEMEKAEIIFVDGKSCNPYAVYCVICDHVGVLSAGGWILWLWCAIVAKSTQCLFAIWKKLNV